MWCGGGKVGLNCGVLFLFFILQRVCEKVVILILNFGDKKIFKY